MRAILAASAFLLLAIPASAQAPGGSISGTIDEQSVSWSVNSMQSDFSGNDLYRSVNIMGWKGQQFEGLGQIMLGFQLQDDLAEQPEIQIMSSSGAPHLYGNEDTGAIVDVISIAETDGFLNLTGLIISRLGTSDDHGRSLDMTNPMQLELTFDVVVEVLGH